MKKSIIALAVAGALTAPIVAQADATLYGRVHQRIVFAEDQDINVENAEARLGVKGSSEMDSGLTSFYQIEFGLNGDNDLAGANAVGSNGSRQTGGNTLQVRQMNAGVKGDFGTLTIGRFTNPLTATYKSDVFEKESGPYQLAPYRIGNAVSYATPNMSGVSASLGMIAEGQGDDSTFEEVDGYVATVNGAFGDFSAALSYMDVDYLEANNSANEAEITSLGLAYSANGLYVGLNIENDDVADVDVIDFAVKYSTPSSNTDFGIGYAQKDWDSSKQDADRTFVGVYQGLGGSADVYAELAKHNATTATGVDSDATRLTLGYRVKF